MKTCSFLDWCHEHTVYAHGGEGSQCPRSLDLKVSHGSKWDSVCLKIPKKVKRCSVCSKLFSKIAIKGSEGMNFVKICQKGSFWLNFFIKIYLNSLLFTENFKKRAKRGSLCYFFPPGGGGSGPQTPGGGWSPACQKGSGGGDNLPFPLSPHMVMRLLLYHPSF